MNRNFFSMPAESAFVTAGGLSIRRSVRLVDVSTELDHLIDDLDSRPGVLLSSGMQVPGRYDNFDLGFSRPPLKITLNAMEVPRPTPKPPITALSSRLPTWPDQVAFRGAKSGVNGGALAPILREA